MRPKYFLCLMGFSAAVSWASSTTSANAETTLRAVTGLSAQSVVSQVFLRWVAQVNERGKGLVQIKYMGGPEITPGYQQAAALKRGLFDISYAPAAFYAGEVKEVDALIASNLPIETMRKNGAIGKLDTLWRQQLGAHVLGWFVTEVRFHAYLTEKPRMSNGRLDLSGIKLFTTPSLRELQIKLGATPVQMKFTEILTSLDRGVINGVFWPEYGMTALGFQRVIKYRIDPRFYRGNILTLVNAKKWDSLSAEVKAFLTKEAVAYEKEVDAWVKAQIDKEQEILKKAGMQVIVLEGEAGRDYQRLAHDIAWQRLEKRSPQEAAALKALMYDPKKF